MQLKTDTKPHWSFWLIGGGSLLWNVGGVINFLSQMNTDRLADTPEWMRAFIESRPDWATAAFALAVFAGTVGCLLLLLRKPVAYNFLFASFVGVLVHLVPFLGVGGSKVVPRAQIWVASLMSLILAVFLLWYERYAERKAWVE